MLVFPPLPEEDVAGLAQALPIHLSTKIGVVGGSPFRSSVARYQRAAARWQRVTPIAKTSPAPIPPSR